MQENKKPEKRIQVNSLGEKTMVTYEIKTVDSEDRTFFYSEIDEEGWYVTSPMYTSSRVCNYESMKACIRVKDGMNLEETVQHMKLDPMVP